MACGRSSSIIVTQVVNFHPRVSRPVNYVKLRMYHKLQCLEARLTRIIASQLLQCFVTHSCKV